MVLRRGLLLTLSLVMLSILSSGPLAGRAAEAESVAWHHEMKSAWNSAQTAQRPIVLFLTMNGCYHCQRMKSQTYQNAAVVDRIRESYVAASINGPQQPDLARKLGVQVYPTTVILSPDARVLDSIRGYVPPAELQERLTSISNRLRTARR